MYYCRLVKGTVASAGKIKGLRGAKLGNPYLRWAFGEAAVIAKRDHYQLKPLAQRLEAKMNGNKFKANTVIAIKLARAAFFMHGQVVFEGELAQGMVFGSSKSLSLMLQWTSFLPCRSMTQTYIWCACRSIPQLYSVVEV